MTTAQLLATAAGAAISLLLSYFPKLKDFYDAQTAGGKALVLLVALTLTAGVLFADGCIATVNVFPDSTLVACTTQGAVDLVVLLLLSIGGSQGAFLLSPRSGTGVVRRNFARAKGFKPI